MQKVLHKAGSRGCVDHGWLKARHTFSFAGYYDPQRIHFGKLRVLNDDIIEPGMGFGAHPHDNMEIITIPIEGALAHKDSTGRSGAIYPGDVQIMSAGSGLSHSEFNHSKEERVNLLQIWIFPDKKDIQPVYNQKSFKPEEMKNQVRLIVSPEGRNGSLKINQQAYLSLSRTGSGRSIRYNLHEIDHLLYVFLISGKIELDGQILNQRDGLGLLHMDRQDIQLTAIQDSHVLFMEVPGP